MYQPFESTTATFVEDEEALAEMLHELKQAKEIAIDLEHHDSRTYIGIVSLMQITPGSGERRKIFDRKKVPEQKKSNYSVFGLAPFR